MNLVMIQRETYEANPHFWYELISWDGHLRNHDLDRYVTYAEAGFPLTPERYRGWVQYGMWILTPRVMREWRPSGHSRELWWSHFSEVIRAVDLVHADPVLKRFWQKGELVANHDRAHPYQDNIPEKWQNVDRWFHLTTNLDPTGRWRLTTRIPVFTQARLIGGGAAAGMADLRPCSHGRPGRCGDHGPGLPDRDYKCSAGGSFYHVQERDGSVIPIGDAEKIELAPVDPDRPSDG
jgi:hypothetical protein